MEAIFYSETSVDIQRTTRYERKNIKFCILKNFTIEILYYCEDTKKRIGRASSKMGDDKWTIQGKGSLERVLENEGERYSPDSYSSRIGQWQALA
jgi:hypothetical protein